MSFRELNHIAKRSLKHFLVIFIRPLIKLIVFTSHKNSDHKLPIFLRQQFWATVSLKYNSLAFKIFLYLNFGSFRVVQFSIFIVLPFSQKLFHIFNWNVAGDCFLRDYNNRILLSFIEWSYSRFSLNLSRLLPLWLVTCFRLIGNQMGKNVKKWFLRVSKTSWSWICWFLKCVKIVNVLKKILIAVI